MTEEKINISPDIPAASVKASRKISLVWLVPLVALLIGGWLVVKAIVEKGPTITITFKSAEGLEAGKTKIKYKDVEVGQVTAISLSEDTSHVVVTVEMVKQVEAFLSKNTRFWVVRARVAGGDVSGLGTLFSGAYIAVDPGERDGAERRFEGLEIPPVTTTDLPGRHFMLEAKQLGSINYGAPVYYRQIRVGQVDGYSLDETGEKVQIRVFIQAPYHQFVRTNTRFWQASGLDFEMNAQGIRVDTQSLLSLMIGGIAFGPLEGSKPGEAADEEAIFMLADSYTAAQKNRFAKTGRFLLHFNQSIRGLSVGAPVEFRGFQLGEVSDIRLDTGHDVEKTDIVVTVDIETERIGLAQRLPEERKKTMLTLVGKGLRAQLKTGNLLTGQLFVDLDYHPDAPAQLVDFTGEHPTFPTIPSDIEGMMNNVSRFLAKLDKVPVEEIGHNMDRLLKDADSVVASAELKEAVRALGETLREFKTSAQILNTNTLPGMGNALVKLEGSLSRIETMLDSDAPLQYELQRALKEMTEAANAVKIMAGQIEEHPESLIRGK